ncbi:MAG TPA: hypothetical protein VLI69_08190 [Gammaproteobacteria bacterium]|nr:hypothetical protein [Gammaproteobacteria bacterium]
MVKIPRLDELKKMGSGLIDSAKTVNLSGMVDKLKTGIESVSQKTAPYSGLGDDPLGKLIQDAKLVLSELAAANSASAAAIKKMQNQLAEIEKVAAGYQRPAAAEEETSQQKSEDKNDENKPA